MLKFGCKLVGVRNVDLILRGGARCTVDIAAVADPLRRAISRCPSKHLSSNLPMKNIVP